MDNIKSVKIESPDLISKVKVLAKLFGITSEVDINIIVSFYEMSKEGEMKITPQSRRVLCVKTGLKETTYTGSLTRLVTKGVFAKMGMVYMLHPAFRNIDKAERLVINF